MDHRQSELSPMMASALTHHRAGELAEAEVLYLQLLAVAPDCFDAWHLLGVLNRQRGRLNEAIHLMERSLLINDQEPAVFNNLGVAHQAAGHRDEAETQYRRALALMPGYADAHYNLGTLLAESGRYGEAETSYRRAILFNPRGVEACNNLGAMLRGVGREEEAVALYRQAVALRPSGDIYGNLGSTLRGLGQAKEAEAAYREALALNPGFVEADHNLSLLQLLQGNYEEGFARNEIRFAVGTGKKYQELVLGRFPPCGRWRGESLAGRSLLVITEQGLGDNLMMMRYLPLLKDRQLQRLSVCCHRPELLRVMGGAPGVDDVVLLEEVQHPGKLDLHCPIMSLPHLLGSRMDSIPRTVPYLRTPAGTRGFWRSRLGALEGVKVGLAWAGCYLNQDDSSRTVPLRTFAPLMRIEGICFVSLQREEGRDELAGVGWDIVDWMDECPDLLDTAALVAELDLVISVDTAMAHLAGALGKPVWLLNRFASEWRWMLDREDSPWYPGMKIFRQPHRGDWDSVIRRVAEELESRKGE